MKCLNSLFRIGFVAPYFLASTIALSQTNFWQTTKGSVGGPITGLAINSKGDIFAASGFVFRSTDNGDTWTQLTLPSYPYGITTLATAPNGKVIGGAYGAIFMSTDNGNAWSKKASIYDYYTGNYDVTSFVVRPDSVIFAGTIGGGLYFSDGGYQWYQSGAGGSNMLESMALDSKGYLLTGDYNGPIGRSQSGSGGWTWANRSLYGSVNALVTIPPSSVFAAGYVGVERSTNDAGSFTAVNTGLTRLKVNSMVVNSQGVLFVGTDSAGVFRSTNSGTSWSQINSGLTDKLIGSPYNNRQPLAISPNGYLFAGTQSGVVFRSVQSTVTSVKGSHSEAPEKYSLHQNYPNPFNPATAIRYTVSSRSVIDLAVFTTLGEKLQTLVSEVRDPGEYQVEFDGSHLPSGVYFYRIMAGGYAETRKMVLTK